MIALLVVQCVCYEYHFILCVSWLFLGHSSSSHLDHGRVDACAEALDLADGEEPVLGGAPHPAAHILLDGLQDLVGAAQPAGGRRANLDVVLA